jgi:hypothetical protein
LTQAKDVVVKNKAFEAKWGKPLHYMSFEQFDKFVTTYTADKIENKDFPKAELLALQKSGVAFETTVKNAYSLAKKATEYKHRRDLVYPYGEKGSDFKAFDKEFKKVGGTDYSNMMAFGKKLDAEHATLKKATTGLGGLK